MTNCQLTRSVRSDLETAVSTVERGELALRGYCQNTVDAWPCLNPRNTTSHLVIYMFRWLLRVSEYVFSPCWWLGHHRCEAMPLEQNWFLTTIRSCNLQVADSELWQENASRNPFGCQPEGFDRQLSNHDVLLHFLTMSRHGLGQVAKYECTKALKWCKHIYMYR